MTEEQRTILQLLTVQADVVDTFYELWHGSEEERKQCMHTLFDKLLTQHNAFVTNKKAMLEIVNRWEVGE